jgi:hypothetical protein
MAIFPLLRELNCVGDVSCLRLFRASNKQEDKSASALTKINAISWSIIDPQFAHALANWFHIAEIS